MTKLVEAKAWPGDKVKIIKPGLEGVVVQLTILPGMIIYTVKFWYDEIPDDYQAQDFEIEVIDEK
jgi:hypothetical protein